jgi:hypothetical protein
MVTSLLETGPDFVPGHGDGRAYPSPYAFRKNIRVSRSAFDLFPDHDPVCLHGGSSKEGILSALESLHFKSLSYYEVAMELINSRKTS